MGGHRDCGGASVRARWRRVAAGAYLTRGDPTRTARTASVSETIQDTDQALAPADAAVAPPATCENCATPLQGQYCYACGQSAHNPLKHVGHALEEVFESFWHLDGRIFRTLRDLLVPGRVAINYLAGHRVRYVAPLRLFVVLTVLTFFIAHFTIRLDNVNIGKDGIDNSDLGAATTVAEVERIRDASLAGIAAGKQGASQGGINISNAMISAEKTVRSTADERIKQLREAQAKGLPPPPPMVDRLTDGKPIKLDRAPGFFNDWLNRQVDKANANIARLKQDPSLLKDAALSAVPSTLFVLVPVFALMLRIAYLLKPWRYLEHLVVALYSHAFLLIALLAVFAMMSLQDWVAPIAPWLGVATGWLKTLAWWSMPAYLLVMQKRVYRQGWPMTVLKWFVLGTVYLVMLSFGAVYTLLYGLVKM